ncbi:MAG: hypothetical protein ACE365_05585 [Gammaproteobacteria bacterium]
MRSLLVKSMVFSCMLVLSVPVMAQTDIFSSPPQKSNGEAKNAIKVPDQTSFNQRVQENKSCVAKGETTCNGRDISELYSTSDPKKARQAIRDARSSTSTRATTTQRAIPGATSTRQVPSNLPPASTPSSSSNDAVFPAPPSRATQPSNSSSGSGAIFPQQKQNSSGSGSDGSDSGGGDFVVY